MRYLFAKAETLTPQRPSNMASGISSKILEIRNENIKRCMGDTIAHRQQYIDTVDGVIYYDDSKAENVNATWFTFENIVNPVVWIVGTRPEVTDPDDVEEVFQFRRQFAETVRDLDAHPVQFLVGLDGIQLLVDTDLFRRDIEVAVRDHGGLVGLNRTVFDE